MNIWKFVYQTIYYNNISFINDLKFFWSQSEYLRLFDL